MAKLTIGREINVSNIGQTGVTRTDLPYVRPDGSVGIIEIKTGGGGNTFRQTEIFPQIQDGSARVTSQLADFFAENDVKNSNGNAITAGQTLAEAGFADGIPIYQIRAPGLE